jgi:hypothetical protein
MERLASRIAAKLLIFCATSAAKRKDWHLVNHVLAAVAAGNTGRTGCTSDCALHDLTGHQVRTLVKALTNGDFNTPAGEPIQR